MSEQRNLILAIALSLIVLIGWQAFFMPPAPNKQQATTSQSQELTPSVNGMEGAAIPGFTPTNQKLSRSEILLQSERIIIDAPRLTGSVQLLGAKFDDIIITDHKTSKEPDAENVTLFAPSGASDAYYAEFGWSSSGRDEIKVPNKESLWQADGMTLRPDAPLTLTWDNGEGLLFKKVINVDDNYIINVQQSVTNSTSRTVTLFPWGLINREGTPKTDKFLFLHEGIISVFNETLKEIKYKDLQEEKRNTSQPTVGGWTGITDKYWLAALIPDQQRSFVGNSQYQLNDTTDRYQVNYIYNEGIKVEANGTSSTESLLFVGAKEVKVLDKYAENYQIIHLDRAVYFGWFYWITKPLFEILHYLYQLTGNFGIAIILVTLTVKLAFFPLANTSYKSMSRMRKLQPQMLELREKYSEDRTALSREMMALYKKEKINPMAGCLPILLQIPVFFALYKVLYVTIEMRHAPFYLWIEDLSTADPTTIWNLFGLLPWNPEPYIPSFLMLGVLPIFMGFTMWLQQKLNPQPIDPTQKKILQLIPFMFTLLLATFPAGLVIYWTANNVLSILQQWLIMKKDRSI